MKKSITFSFLAIFGKIEKSITFSGKIHSITTKVVIKVFFLRQKSKRKGKGAVSSAPLSFVSSLTKGAKKHKNWKGKIKMEIEFFLPMKKIPTTTHQQKQVRVVNGKPQFYEPANLQEAREKYMSMLARHVPSDQLEGPVRLTVKWLFPKIKGSSNGQYKTTKPDTDNLQKLLKDCMTDSGFWKDDAQVASEIVEKFWSDTVGIYIRVEVLE